MTRSVIDPITRIEGHLRVEMEVQNGVVTDAWVSGGCFRGMELVVENRTPEDAAQIVQRICGVCPVSHAHASSIAAEKAYGITIPNNARIIRNLIEGAQFLHSNILWFYNLAALDYVNPLNALTADPADAYDLAQAAGTSMNSDFVALKERLAAFAANGQLSIFSGNWFDADDGTAYKLCDEIYNWVEATMIPDTLALAPYYSEAFNFGKGCGRYIAWGVFERAEGFGGDYIEQMKNRYMPMGVLDENLNVSDVQENLITEYVGHSWYKGEDTYTSPYFTTEPEFTEYNVEDRYSWVKCPAYDGKPMEAGSMARLLSAYVRGVPFIVDQVDGLLETLGAPGDFSVAQSTLGRTAIRQIETLYIAGLMREWVDELIEAVKSGDSEYFRAPSQISGKGTGFWEAPRGALYHSEEVKDGKITGYQIIIPSTWNLAPKNANGENGPLEQALIGCPVGTIDKPINALRTVHSFDPCTACAVHITEPATGKSFETVTSPWGVK